MKTPNHNWPGSSRTHTASRAMSSINVPSTTKARSTPLPPVSAAAPESEDQCRVTLRVASTSATNPKATVIHQPVMNQMLRPASDIVGNMAARARASGGRQPAAVAARLAGSQQVATFLRRNRI